MIKKLKCGFIRNKFFILFLLTWIGVLSGMRTLQHYSFWTNACDLSLFDYGMSYTLKGELMSDPFHKFDYGRWMSENKYLEFEPARGPKWESHFCIHFTPIAFFIVPLYLIFNGPLFLLNLQVLLVGLSAVPLYLTAKHIFKSPFVPSLIAVIYLFFRHLVIGLMQDFHFEMLFPLFFFSCYYFIAVKKEPALYFLFMTLTLFIREDIPIYLFFWGLFLIFKRKEKKIGILTSALSLSYFCLAIFVVIPYFRSQAGLTTPYVYQHVWGHLGKNNLQILWSLLMHPWLIFQGVPIAVVLRKLLDIVLPLGLLPLFSSYGSLIGPPLLVAILSRIPQNYMFGLHYSATVLPFVFLGFIYGLKGIAGRLERKSAVSGKRIFLAVVILITAVNLMNSNLWRWTSPARYRAVKDYRSVQRLISQIPPDASVAALSSLIPHIPRRKAIFMLPETGGAEYILIHSGINLWPYTKEEYDRVLKKIESEKNYYCLARLGDARLFKKKPQ